MSKTNSNSITSILIYALNNEKSNFRKMMLSKFRSEYSVNISDKILFYDGTHSPLKLKEMKNTEVDIFAREPGKYKISLMIEIKAGLSEPLQPSQGKKGAYKNTSVKYAIPLFYIIPQNYKHERDLPDIRHIIYWEKLLDWLKKNNDKTGLAEQISNFVELTDSYEPFSPEEKKLLRNKKELKRIYDERERLKADLGNCIKNESPKFSESQYEFGYYWNGYTSFLGYNYVEDKYILTLDIAESVNNAILGNSGFYYMDGWYYIPIKKDAVIDVPTISELKKIQKTLYESLDISKLSEINYDIQNIQTFYTLTEKIKILCKEKISNIGKAEGFGYYYKGNKKFIGINFSSGLTQNYFSFSILKKNEWKYISLYKIDKKLFETFLDSKSFEELKQNFSLLVDKALKESENL